MASSAQASCDPSDARPVVSIRVHDPSKIGSAAGLDARALESLVVQTVRRLPGVEVRPAKPQEVPWQISLSLSNADASTSGLAVDLVLLQLKPGGPSVRFEAQVTRIEGAGKGGSLESVIKGAIEEAMIDLKNALDLEGAPEEKVLDALASQDERIRSRGVLAAHERKLRSAVPALMRIAVSDAESQALALKAVGALVSIGDPRAVGALIDAGRRRSGPYLGQILFAVGEIGGKEAEAYLFTVSTGHADPEVRRNASDALLELEKKAGRKRNGWQPSTIDSRR